MRVYRASPLGLVNTEPASEQAVDQANNDMVTLATALDPTNDGIRTYPEASRLNMTASGLVKTGTGRVQGIVINSHSSGTIKLWDNTAGSGTVLLETITLVAGERNIRTFGATFGVGLFITIGGTANITVMFN